MTKKKRDYKRVKPPLTRSDKLQTCRSVTVRIGNDQYVKLRSKLFLVELSLQNVFNEFVDLLLEEDKRALSIMNGILERRRTCKLRMIKMNEQDKKVDLTSDDRDTIYEYFDKDSVDD